MFFNKRYMDVRATRHAIAGRAAGRGGCAVPGEDTPPRCGVEPPTQPLKLNFQPSQLGDRGRNARKAFRWVLRQHPIDQSLKARQRFG